MKKCLSFLILLQCSFSLLAQWTNDTDLNTLGAASETSDVQSIGASDGSTYIAYWHNVAAPKYYEMRLQRLDVDGNLMFGPQGMVVNNTVQMGSFTTTWSMAIDQDDNVYIGFNGSAGNNSVYVHKISPNGTQIWGNSGKIMGTGFDVKMLPLSNGDVVVFWLPGDKAVMQKLDPMGVLKWPNTIIIQPAMPSHKTSAGEMLELSDGGFEVIIHDRSGSSTSALPYVQRYNSNGQGLWISPLALSNGYYTSYNRRYPLVQDGDNLYFGYTGAQGIQSYAFLQRIDPNGTIPWGINGIPFSSQSANFERDLKIAFAPGANAIWGICEYSDPSQGQLGEYVQKFDKVSGLRLLTDQGKELYPIGPALISHRGSLQLVDNKPLFIVSNGDANGVFPKDLLAVYLDENGDFAWPEKTRPVATNATGVKSRVQFNQPFQQQATCVWAEVRNGAISRPFAQNISLACTDPVSSFNATLNNLKVTVTSTASNSNDIAWFFGDGAMGLGNSATHLYATEGTYTICQVAANQCGIDSSCQQVTLLMSSTNAPEDLYNLALIPNPNQGTCTIQMDVPKPDTWTYRIFTADGHLVLQQAKLLDSGRQHILINAPNLIPGVYFVHLSNGMQNTVISMVIQ